MFIAGGTYVAPSFVLVYWFYFCCCRCCCCWLPPMPVRERGRAKLKPDYIWLCQFLKQFFLLFVQFLFCFLASWFAFAFALRVCVCVCFPLLWRMRGLLNLIKFLWLIWHFWVCPLPLPSSLAGCDRQLHVLIHLEIQIQIPLVLKNARYFQFDFIESSSSSSASSSSPFSSSGSKAVAERVGRGDLVH